jgi:para-nitrobenzyl esterase
MAGAYFWSELREIAPYNSMMKHSYPWLAIVVIFCAGAANPVHAAIEYAEATGGRVQGEVHDGLASFKGLSFASPPVGALRWRVPQPVVAWSGVRKADTFAPACMQPWPDNLNLIRPSEDCLYLNVWTAAATAKERRPVMVWIHGGGLTNGMSWETLSHGTKLAPEGVVLVTIAYRLGAFGFLAHPDLTRESGKGSGNYGLFDAVAALKWVQANIAQFGGDPSRVTIFGGSSGALMVSLLAGAPAAKGLYARAIAQGGSGFHPSARYPRYIDPLPPLRDAEARGADFFKSLGVSDLKSARHLSAGAILKATDAAAPGFRPTLDGDLLIGSSFELFQQGRFNDTPILVGFTSDELGADPPKSLADWLESVIERSRCTETQAAIAAAYPPTRDAPTNTPTNMNRYLFRDFYAGWPAWTWARLQSTKGHNHSYLYFFDVHDREHSFGAPHAAEYPFVFGNFPKPPSAGDEATSALMRQYWINFAAHGDPNGPGLPIWKAFDEDSQSAMVFDNSSGSRRLPNIDGLKLLDELQRCGTSRAGKRRT